MEVIPKFPILLNLGCKIKERALVVGTVHDLREDILVGVVGLKLCQDLHAVLIKVVSEGKQLVANRSAPTTAPFHWVCGLGRRGRRQCHDSTQLFKLSDGLFGLFAELVEDILELNLVRLRVSSGYRDGGCFR